MTVSSGSSFHTTDKDTALSIINNARSRYGLATQSYSLSTGQKYTADVINSLKTWLNDANVSGGSAIDLSTIVVPTAGTVISASLLNLIESKATDVYNYCACNCNYCSCNCNNCCDCGKI